MNENKNAKNAKNEKSCKNAKNAKNEKSCKSAKNDNSGAKLPAGTPSSQNDGYTVNDTTDPAVPNRARTQMKKNG